MNSNFIKNHLAIVLLGAIVVGLLYVGPPIMIWRHFNGLEQNFVLAQFKTTRDALYTYIPRDREVYDGHFPPSELYAKDDKKSTARPILPAIIFAYFIGLFKGDINLAYLSVQFLFSGIIFSLFYILGWLLFKNRLWSCFFALTATLTPIPLILPFGFEGASEFISLFIKNFVPAIKTQIDKLYLHDIENPLLTYPFYISAIISLLYFVKKPKPITAMLTGVLAGILAYVYFHIWLFWLVATSLACLSLIILEHKDRKFIKNCLLLLVILLIVTLPYFITYLQLKSAPQSDDYIDRLGILNSREIGLNSTNAKDFMVYVLLGLLVYFSCHRNDPKKCVLWLSIIAAMLLIWNLQVLTGFVPVPHTWRKAISPLIFILVFLLLHDFTKQLKERKPALKNLIAAGLIILSLTVAVKKIINVAVIAQQPQSFIVKYYKFYDPVVNSWQWINKNMEPEPKILSPSTLTSLYLNSYTSARPFLPTAFLTSMTTEEIEKRYLLAHKMFRVDSETLARRLEGILKIGCEAYDCPPDKGSNLNDSAWHIYGNYFMSRYGRFDNFTGESSNIISLKRTERHQALLERYANLKNASWTAIDAGYVYFGPLEKDIAPTINLANESKLKPVFKNSRVEIYIVKK